jgi:hypothetical protein
VPRRPCSVFNAVTDLLMLLLELLVGQVEDLDLRGVVVFEVLHLTVEHSDLLASRAGLAYRRPATLSR